MPWRRVVTIDSSTLFWIRTGRFALRASATVIGSILVYDLLPNPPPSQGTTMRTLATGKLEEIGDLGPHQEGMLAIGMQRHLVPGGVPLGDGGVGFHGVLVDRRKLVLPFDHDIGVGEDVASRSPRANWW